MQCLEQTISTFIVQLEDSSWGDPQALHRIFILSNQDPSTTCSNILAMGAILLMLWTLSAVSSAYNSGQSVIDFAATKDLSIGFVSDEVQW